MATPQEQRDQEQRQQNQDLVSAIEKLNRQMDRVADSTAKTADKIADSTTRITRVVRSSDELAKAGLSATRTGLVVGGTAATLVAAQRRGRLGQLARGAAVASGVFGGVNLGGGAAGGRFAAPLRVISSLIPPLKLLAVGLAAAAGARALFGRRGSGAASSETRLARLQAEAERQTALMTSLVRESRVSNNQFKTAFGRRQAALDPFNRSPAFFANRRLSFALGANAPTESQANRLARVVDARRERAESRGALGRSFAELSAPYREVTNRAIARLTANTNFWVRTIAPVARGVAAVAPLTSQLAISDFLLRRSTGGRIADEPRRGGALGGIAERELFRLQTRGPGSIVQPVPTARVGTESDYALRVQLQREELQREVTRAWQDQILAAIRELVDLGKLDEDELYRKRVEFGRPVTGV